MTLGVVLGNGVPAYAAAKDWVRVDVDSEGNPQKGEVFMKQRKNDFQVAKKFFLCLILCVAMALSSTGMVHAQEQPFWNYNGKNYFYVNETGGLTRVFTDSPTWFMHTVVYVENYDSSLQLQSRLEIPGELRWFSSFFAGAEYNYIIFGQENPNEDNNTEVIRVVKYSKNWERLGHTSICGANTTVPFDAGACRCAEAGGMLYIHTCHEMYRSRDGKNHQANMTLVIRESDMALTDKKWGVSYLSTGYVSHSFDQYVIADQNGNIVHLDLGDGYPRALVLTRFSGKAGKETLGNASAATIQKISGEIGDNRTGVIVGGFAETNTGYVTAYSYDEGTGGAYSIYLAYTDKSNLNTKTVRLSAPGASVSAPKLVPTGTDGGYILWNDSTAEEKVLYYASYSADGSVGEFHAAHAELDITPIYFNGKIVWFDRTRTNIKSNEVYDMIMNIYLLDDKGVEAITVPAMYPFPAPIVLS